MHHSAERRGQALLRASVVHAWRGLAAAGLALFAGWTLHHFGGSGTDRLFNAWLYNGLVLLAVAGLVLRVAWVRTERSAWLLLALAVGAWAVGEIVFDFAYGGSPPFPSVADAFYLAFYPLCYVGLILLVRSRISRPNASVWLDGVTAALAAASVSAALIVEVVMASTSGTPAAVVTNLAYPLGDTILLALVIGVFAVSGWRPGRAWTLLGASLAASAVADGLFLYQSAKGTYSEGTVLDALWPASMLLLAAAAWQPVDGAARRIELQGRPLLAPSAVGGAAAFGVLGYDHFHKLHALGPALALATLAAILGRASLTFRENARILARIREQAVTDSLTGLANRRKLVADLDRVLATLEERSILVIFDLDGFKSYNDTYGHPAGDALLARLGAALAAVTEPHGGSYRLGGDEFCVLAPVAGTLKVEALLDVTAGALSESGDGFSVRSSFGAVFLPDEASDPREALRIADQRLYVQKNAALGRGQPHELLLEALFEREPELRGHIDVVAELSLAVGRRLGLSGGALAELKLAAELHDIGKLAVPDAVLRKEDALDESEWRFIRQHTLIGQRILGASPALNAVGVIVRSTHERWDGSGYVDGLAGEEIPVAARIIAACDAYAAMTSNRPYRRSMTQHEALAELRECTGTHFDPSVVAMLCEALALAPSARDAA